MQFNTKHHKSFRRSQYVSSFYLQVTVYVMQTILKILKLWLFENLMVTKKKSLMTLNCFSVQS